MDIFDENIRGSQEDLSPCLEDSHVISDPLNE